MANKGTYFTSKNQPQNRRSRKGCPNFFTEFERVYKLRKAEEIQKELKDGTFKNVKLSALQYLINIRLEMLEDKDTPTQVKEKIIEDLMPYLCKKEAEQIDINANVQQADITNLSSEERLKAFRELMGITEEESEE